MEDKQNQRKILSSWKEISDYLGYNRRTCSRWEKEYGLPVHRMDDKPKSSVFANPQELDEWLEKKLKTNQVHKKKDRKFHPALATMIFAVVLLLVSAYFFLPKLKIRSNPTEETVTPQSTGPLTLQARDVVTTEFDGAGRLRVWRRGEANTFREVWRIEPVRHSSFVISDVDYDGADEIAAPGYCRRVETKGERKRSFYQYFINVYKQGRKDWWKSTYFNDADCVFEDERVDLTEMAEGELDGNPGSEIVLITRSSLGIFKYDKDKEEIRLLRSQSSFVDGTALFLKSVTVADIDPDPGEEIIVSADEWKDFETVKNSGWILILKFRENHLNLVRSIRVDANLSHQSLRTGNILRAGSREIVTPAYRNIGGAWNTYVLGWDATGNKLFDKPVYTRGDYQYQIVQLDVGDILPDFGDEILLANQAPDELILYYWDGDKLVESTHFPLDPWVALTKVFISRNNGPENTKEIIACGGNFSPTKPGNSGDFYLEVISFENSEFISKWQRNWGEKRELRVSYGGFGKRHD